MDWQDAECSSWVAHVISYIPPPQKKAGLKSRLNDVYYLFVLPSSAGMQEIFLIDR